MVTEDLLGHVVSVNVGEPRPIRWRDRTVTTAIWKRPVDNRVRVAGVNIAGDDQADRRVHGGSTKAVYAYSVGDYDWWATQLGRPLAPGTFGDNLTVDDIDLTSAVIGEKWRVSSAILRVTEPRIPCFKLGIRLGDEAFVRRFADGARPGTYLAIEESGDVGAGDPIQLHYRPGHAITVGTVERAHHGAAHLLPSLVDLDDLSAPWRAWARRRLARVLTG